MELIKVYDTQNHLNNVIIPLSLPITRVVFVTHDKPQPRQKKAMIDLLNNHDIEVDFYELEDDERQAKAIFEKYAEAIVDISSNRYLNFYLFEKAIRQEMTILYYDEMENVIKDYRTHDIYTRDLYRFTIKEMIELAGGSIKDTMHSAPDLNDHDFINKIKKVMTRAIDDYGLFTGFISRIMQALKGRDQASLNKKQQVSLKTSPFYELFSDLGIIDIKNSRLTIDRRFKLLLINVGSWLESYFYILIKESGDFDDVIMSATIDFSAREDIYPVICEIDGIVALRNRTAFISCKSNKVDTQALNEIKVHNLMFGSTLSKACVFTADDLNVNNPPIFEKAQELDVAIIDKTAIENKAIALVLKKIFEGTYRYERVR